MQLTDALRWVVAVVASACAILIGAPGVVSAALDRASVTFGGPGLTQSGREISLKVTVTNVASTHGTTPDDIARLRVESPSVRFNGNSDSVSTCKARVPTNGDAANCPRSSRVGSGSASGILGEPGKPADMYGALSEFRAKIRLFNYKHSGRQPARILAVIAASKPVGGVAINLILPVTLDGVITIDIPRMSKLPPLIRKSYPRTTALVLTRLSAKVDAPRRKRGSPFLALRKVGEMGATVVASGR